ncbi:MAG: DUF3849 domain-containing protein [Clostridia bacterium]|nr:DUF3849 domain-containing protein [Clostridia bacterium]
MDNEKITVLVVEPEKKPYVKEIEPGLESLQREVGRYIQAVYPFDSPCAIVCGEESKLNGEPLNRALRDDEGHIYDVIAGTFLIVGLGEENFTSLGQKEMQEMSARFAVPEMFMKVDGRRAVSRSDADEPKPDIPPVYLHRASYALKHDEADAYGASYQANVDCRRAIEDAIGDHYRDNRLDVSSAKDIIETFGMERVQTVLASTIQAVDWDGRISDANKKWAKSYPIPDEIGREYHVNGCHRGLTDLFCTEVRRLQREMEKKPSVLGKLADAIPVPHKDKPAKSHHPER